MDFEPKMWGDAEFDGLGYEFDPVWFLTDEDRALEKEIIDACQRVIRPLAIEADRTGEYPRASVDELGRLRLLAMIAPGDYGCRASSHTQVLMATEAIARYGCPSTAIIFMMHLVAVAGLVFRAHGNPEIESLLRRMDPEALIGTASYTDPETGGHFWYPKTSGAERVADGWHVRKTAAFTTSSGFADWYLTQTTSPDFAGDYADLSVFLLYPDEVQGNPGTWDAMGMHANQSAPVEIDAVIPENRIVGWPGDGARSNDEAIDPLAFLQYAGAYNGLAMACLDVARRHALRRAHAQYGRRIADYATSQDAYGRALCEAQASRLFAYGLAKALDDATDGGDWTMYAGQPRRGAAGGVHVVGPGGQGAGGRARQPGVRRDAAAVRRPRVHAGGRDRAAGARLQGRLGDGAVQRGVAADRRPLGAARRRTPSTGGTRRSTSARCATSSASWTTRRSGGWWTSSRASSPRPAPDPRRIDGDDPATEIGATSPTTRRCSATSGMKPELVVREPTDERVWIEIEPNVWFRPLFFDMNNGSHGEVLRVRRGGVLCRHRHPSPGARLRDQGQLALPRALVGRPTRAPTCSSRPARSTR